METRKSHTDVLRRAKRALLPLLPRGQKVRWALVEIPGGVFGRAWMPRPGRWTIELDSRQGPQLLKDTIVHEFAHVLAGTRCEPDGDHGPVWGVLFAECYRAVYEHRRRKAR